MEKMSGESLDIVADNIVKLKQIFPEVFNEDKVDFEKLEQVLGEYKDTVDERYSFTWPGKSQAIRITQTPSTGTLRPCKEESVNWDDTENLYIEGDNLEVLKLLQKSYYGKVKMIYIDPPYNTGNDFVYKDDFKDNVSNYLKVTGQIDDEGNMIGTNSDVSGRYHSNWLNMMYPRLKLARNLLKINGCIFISIDDNEVSNLKTILDELYGEENFIAQFTWRRTDNQANIGSIARVKEYILCYCKNKSEFKFNKLPLSEKAQREYSYEDEKGKFRRKNIIDKSRGKKYYKIITPSGEILEGPWMIDEEEFKNLDKEGRIYWASGRMPYGKKYLHEAEGQIVSDLLMNEFGTNQRAATEINELFGYRIFDFSKPTTLIQTFCSLIMDKEDICLDFFSGAATTAHALMKNNLLDGGKRKFIMVQIPEKTSSSSIPFKNGFRNICEIGKERIRRSGNIINNEDISVDTGFKVFNLDSSNIKSWDPSQSASIENQLYNMVNNIKEDRSEEDILYEILLKYGVDLNAPIEEKVIEGKKVYSIGFGAIIACLADNITLEITEGIGALKEELEPGICRVVFKDKGFTSDSVKTNAIQILKRYDIHEVKSI